MKRYVKEFANDLLKEPYCEEVKKQIRRAVVNYERGLITDYETVLFLATLKKDNR